MDYDCADQHVLSPLRTTRHDDRFTDQILNEIVAVGKRTPARCHRGWGSRGGMRVLKNMLHPKHECN